MSKKEENIFNLFLENEYKIEKLYKLYAINFKKHKKLWENLSAEERRHVEILKDLSRKYNGKGNYKASGEQRNIIAYVSNFLDHELEKIIKENVLPEKALEAAIRIERSMVENKCFEIFAPYAEDIHRVFKKLNMESDKHLKKIMAVISSSV